MFSNKPSQIADNRLSEILLKAVETTNEMILVTDAPEQIGDEKIIFVNKAFEEVTQYSESEILGKSPKILQGPKTEREVIDDLVETLSSGKRWEGETFNYKKDGTPYRLSWSIDPIKNEQGETTHFVSVQRDMTESYERRQRLEKIIKERETLIKETHHRIKNNLATITGLLELQILKSDSEEVRNVLRESMNRVQSIASIHEKLYETEGLASITLDSYLEELIRQVDSSIKNIEGQSSIDFEINIQPISIRTTQAVPLGLIINELVTNAHKHAFDEQGGTVAITCQEQDNKIWVEVSDNGKGLPDDLDTASTNSLGIKLIDTLANQLEAEYSFTSGRGTTFEISFVKKQ